ncbi:MAG: multicopper oxidase domain-containing protein [Spirochaetia bacterium]|jgi:blue copper oxidase|nr:multicopper oxidase domain-containing protein [Spirochaetia bacterium]
MNHLKYFIVTLVFLPLVIFAQGFTPFSQELFIPPVLESERTSAGEKIYKLTVQTGSVSFFGSKATPTLGFNGNYLGPTIRLNKGDKVSIKVNNTLNEVTTVHWHGLHIPGEADGGPHQIIESGESWNPVFTVNQQAATLWYHPHIMGTTAEQVYRGLAGMFIIDDPNSDNLDIPKDYGINDIPLIIQDRRFYNDGTFAYRPSRHEIMNGLIGNTVTINGSVKPYLDVPDSMVRFRLLNGSNSSLYKISLSDGTSFSQIASDGGFLEKAVEMNSSVLSPGERAEIIVNFSGLAGKYLSLKVEIYKGREFEAIQFRVEKNSALSIDTIPSRLNRIVRIPESKADITRKFVMQTGMGTFSINGKKMDMSRIDEIVKLGNTEIWEIYNRPMGMMQIPHSFHIHDVQFLILDRNGVPPSPAESGWKDTVLLWPGETVRFITKFEDYTGLYMYHCHFLEHEDDGMMGQFEVQP